MAKSNEVFFKNQVKRLNRSVEPLLVMSIWDVEKAFRILQDGQMIGKITLKMAEESVIPVSGPYNVIINRFHADIRQTSIQSKAGFHSVPNKTYVMAGGTGELGRAIAEWTVYNRGVKDVVLLSRSGLSTK
jgi:hypothetical protein